MYRRSHNSHQSCPLLEVERQSCRDLFTARLFSHTLTKKAINRGTHRCGCDNLCCQHKLTDVLASEKKKHSQSYGVHQLDSYELSGLKPGRRLWVSQVVQQDHTTFSPNIESTDRISEPRVLLRKVCRYRVTEALMRCQTAS